MPKTKSRTTWNEEVELPSFPRLSESLDVDVAVIGAGITGITAAYLLSKAGYNVALIEKDRIAADATYKTTAFLTQYLDTHISELIPMFGKIKTKAILDSHAQAIDLIEHIVSDEHIPCDFIRCSNFIYTNSMKENDALKKEQSAAAQVGLTMKFHEERDLPFKHSGYTELPHQGKFHPLKYLSGLLPILKKTRRKNI